MMNRNDIRNWQLYIITDARLSRGRSNADVVRAAIAGGADVVQFRAKDGGETRRDQDAADVAQVCRKAGVPLIINDDLALCRSVDADGLHVGQDDLPAADARSALGQDRILGVSARTPAEIAKAIQDGADYLGIGPVFDARATKPDAAQPIGPSGLSERCALSTVPVIAIGGITLDTAEAVIRAGATGVAVISAVVTADDITLATSELKQAILAAKL